MGPILFGAVLGLIGLVWFSVYCFVHLAHFLSVTAPVMTDTLIIEGWIPDYAVKEISTSLQNGTYKRALVVGPPLWKGGYLSDYETLAQVTAATLTKLGVSENQLVVIPCPSVDHYRTYTAALAVRQWLLTQDPLLQAVNVFTLTAHARRSWLIYRRTLAPELTVGIIAARATNFKLNRWWLTSAGFRHVMSEAIAYGYARWVDWRA